MLRALTILYIYIQIRSLLFISAMRDDSLFPCDKQLKMYVDSLSGPEF